MNQLKTKTCELDCMPTKLMKEYASVTGPLINTVINKSLEQGEFPEHWKKAIVRPLLKKSGLEMIPKNYRPVSNLSYLSKVLEKSVLKRFMNHCTKEDLIPHHQSAYLPNRSCETSLLKVVNDILWKF